MKKVLISFLIIALLISSFAFTFKAYAANEDVTFEVVSMNGEVSDTVILKVNMNCVNSFAAANFTLRYDDTKLQYVPFLDSNFDEDYDQNRGSTLFNNGNPIGTLLINSNTDGNLKIGYMSQESLAGKSGEFLLFQFNVIASGASNVYFSATTIKDASGNNLTTQITNGAFVGLNSITLNQTSTLELIVDDTFTFTVSSPDGPIYSDVIWSNNNATVISTSVSPDGKSNTITALAPGNARITAQVAGLSVSCNVQVQAKEEPYNIVITEPDWTFLPPTQQRSIAATFDPPESAEGKTLTWSSSNTNVAIYIPATGKIKAVANGSCDITVTDGVKTDTYHLIVSGTLGDIDEDATITAYDAYRALVLYAEQALNNPIEADEAVVLDVDKDESMSSNDSYLILKHSVGLINNFN